MTRRGLSLPELLAALVLLGLLGAVLTRLMLHQGRLAARFFARHAAAQTVAQADDWLSAELSPGGSIEGSPDLLALGADSVMYRAWRSAGLACQVTPGEVRIRRDRFAAWRMPQAGRDSLALFLPGDSSTAGTWMRAPVLATASSVCGSTPAIALSTTLPAPLPATLPALVPVRVYEIALARFYRSLGEWWLGGRSVSGNEGLQPVTGPFLPGGVRFGYRGGGGGVTTRADSVQTIDLEFHADSTLAARSRITRRNQP